MKTLKTWEVIKALSENRKQKFLRRSDNNIYCLEKELYLYPEAIKTDREFVWREIKLSDEWTLVQEPVDFMTAVNSKKRIRHESWPFFHTPYAACGILGGDCPIEVRECINGKWYIEEGE